MKKFILTLIKTVLIAVIVLCVGKVGIKSNGYYKAEKSHLKVKSIKESSINNDSNIKTYNDSNVNNDIDVTTNCDSDSNLISANEDFKFWLKIDNTNIDYPVVQGKDNDFYLKHDFFKSKNASGSIFLDYRVNNKSRNNIIYGHNMKNGSMFANIELFKDEKFFNENKFITIEKNNKQYIYEIFSVYYLDAKNTDYLQCNFNSDEEFDNFIHCIKERSLFKSNKELNSNDIITLSTCSYEGKNFRTAVHAQLIEIN